MKFSFSTKVPMWERLRILWLGGLHISIDYHGQHQEAKAVFDAMPASEVTGNIVKEKDKIPDGYPLKEPCGLCSSDMCGAYKPCPCR